jgi:hypothetical protein
MDVTMIVFVTNCGFTCELRQSILCLPKLMSDTSMASSRCARMTYFSCDRSESGSFDDSEDDVDGDEVRERQRADARAPPGNDSRSEEISDWDDDTK